MYFAVECILSSQFFLVSFALFICASKFISFPQETPNGQKKKIIPVGSDFEEGSPSPEFPSSPVDSPKIGDSILEDEKNQRNKKMNLKWKSSVSK